MAVGAVAVRDLTQKKHALMRNYPVIAHARYWLETIGPELRQYIVTSNDEERPFSRDQRSWIYASSKQENNYFGFGTDNDVEHTPGYAIIKHRTFADVAAARPRQQAGPAQRQGARRSARPGQGVPARLAGQHLRDELRLDVRRTRSWRSTAGAAQAGCMHNTGEGGLSPYHRQGGDIVLQIGTAYFGCRDEDGNFDLDRLKEVVESAPVRGDRDQALARAPSRGSAGCCRRPR